MPIVAFALLPLATSLSDLAFLGIYCAIAAFTLTLDVMGQVGTPKTARCHPAERHRSDTVDTVGGVESME